MKTYDEMILGDAADIIIAEERKLFPRIGELQFKAEVLDLLENVFNETHLQTYSYYVGELTKPLLVVKDDAPEEVLFEVPALMMAPKVSIAGNGGYTAGTYSTALQRHRELGQDANRAMANFLIGILKIPNYVETVITPIRQILARYNRTMVELPGVDNTKKVEPIVTESVTTSVSDDEYED